MTTALVRSALVLACAAATSPLLAQVPTTTPPPPQPAAPPPQAVAPAPRPAAKALSLQVSGSAVLPAFSYNDFLASVGWQAQGALILRRSPFNAIRIEAEYNSTGFDQNATNLTGSAEVYGGGIGGGRVITKGKTSTETYVILGGYENKFATCIANTCSDYSEFQFGTKVGLDAVVGLGKIRPVFDFHWLSTWSQPYASIFAFGLGLRF